MSYPDSCSPSNNLQIEGFSEKEKAHNDVYCSAGTLIFSFEQTRLSGDGWDRSLFLVILY